VEYRLLGRTGLRVSALALGTSTFSVGSGDGYSLYQVDVPAARELLARAVDAGVNLVDTADVYAAGRSEEVLGEAIKPYRDRLLITTKLHGRTGPGANDVGQSRHHIVAALEASLRRLQVDHVDLLLMHGFDELTDPEQ